MKSYIYPFYFINFNYKITMHKYTYLLSDSYRQQPILTTHITYKQQINHIQPSYEFPLSKQIIHKPISIKDRQDIGKQYRLEELTRSRNKSQYNGIENRLKNLDDLSQRHNQAIKDIDLQSKLKAISEKYNAKKINGSNNVYRQYTESKKQLSHDYSFNRMPEKIISEKGNVQPKFESQGHQRTFEYSYKQKNEQNLRISEPSYDINKTKVKIMIDSHLNRANINQNKGIINHKRYDYLKEKNTNSHTPQSDKIQNAQTVAKLSSLQQRINSSIKPYLNI